MERTCGCCAGGVVVQIINSAHCEEPKTKLWWAHNAFFLGVQADCCCQLIFQLQDTIIADTETQFMELCDYLLGPQAGVNVKSDIQRQCWFIVH